MLSDITVPEKEVHAAEPEQLHEFLETNFKTNYCRTTLNQIQFLGDGMIDFSGETMPCTPSFLEAAADSIQMPRTYAFKLEFGLFCENFEQRKDRCSKAVTICINRGVAINLASAEYRPVRTSDAIRGLVDQTFWKFDGARISDRGLEINYLQPGCIVEPSPGDTIELGIRLTNSETGYFGLKASLSSLRLICSNGAVMSDQLGTARWNYDPRVAYQTSIDKFQKDLLKLRSRQDLQVQLYGDGLRRNLLDTELNNLWRRLRASVSASVVDSVLGLQTEERQNLQHAIRERRTGTHAEATNHMLWDVHNRITAAAQRFEFSLRSRFERIGGSMLVQDSLN